mmetsp:Transcript_4656/g.7195  ORF Transcript_4656/g.7195 Transcript_4656/m.7195 type:complete len:113 (-) Transcript_4656:1183-1521(-)
MAIVAKPEARSWQAPKRSTATPTVMLAISIPRPYKVIAKPPTISGNPKEIQYLGMSTCALRDAKHAMKVNADSQRLVEEKTTSFRVKEVSLFPAAMEVKPTSGLAKLAALFK